MIITFDTKILILNKITAHQLVLAFMINEKDAYLINEYLYSSNTLNTISQDLDVLQKVNLIKGYNGGIFNFDKLKITDTFIKILANCNLFDELFLTYPEYVIRPNGKIDKVRIESNNVRALYNRITRGNYHLHEHILQCLREEIDWKERTDTMKYMKKLPKWVSDNHWQSFEKKLMNSSEGEYGTAIE